MIATSKRLAVAVQHHQSGRLQDAEQIYREILTAEPNHPDAIHLLGVIARQVGQNDVAVELIGRAIQLKGNAPEYHNNLAGAYFDLLKVPEAIASFRQAIKLKKDYPDAHCGLGNALREQGRLDEAMASCRRAIELKPDYAEAHNNLGNALKDQDQLEQAIECYELALRLNPNLAVVYNNLGNVFKDLGRLNEAVAYYLKTLELNPNIAEVHNNLGNVLRELGQREEAVACFIRSLTLRSDYAEAHSNLGDVLLDLGKKDDALMCARRALELNPKLASAHNNLGNIFRDEGKIEDATACYRRALELKPDDALVHNNLGNALKDQGRLDEALACYRRALELNFGFAEAHSNLLASLHYCAGVSLDGLAAAHAEFDRLQAAPLRTTSSYQLAEPRGRRVRLGFVSADLWRHPVGYFLVRVFENFDKHKIETVVYSDGKIVDDLTQRMQSTTSQWHHTKGLSDEQLAQKICADHIDILFDLAGHTAHNRLLTFARKPAPIQVTWAGYVGTTGLTAMDYIVADRFEIPEGTEQFYQERVIRMPDGYVCYDPPKYTPPVTPLPMLERGSVTFGCFNNPSKITPGVVEVWARILGGLPNSRLVLKYKGWDDPSYSVRVANKFAETIDPGRIEFSGYSPHDKLLAAYGRIDIALDPFPYSGGLTTCEAMWMGVPVVTFPGETFASRHSLSHLSNVGLSETIANHLDEYVDIAVKLANDPKRLSSIRDGLRDRMANSPLCDGMKFAMNLTSLLEGLVSRY